MKISLGDGTSDTGDPAYFVRQARFFFLSLSVIALSAALPLQTQAAASETIAGLKPDERPAGAPTITQFQPSADFQKRAGYGIVHPIPPSLGFVKDQGAWYSPFFYPGMYGAYDIRGWHPKSSEQTTGSAGHGQ